jgi:transcriptional regulator with XRE-family HTH domain
VKRVDEAVHEFSRDIGIYIREQRSNAKMSLRQLARLAGVSNPYLSQVERGLRNPSAQILQQIAKGLRISAEVLYVQAGILDPRAGGAVVDAVAADPHLSERQKQVLLDIYDSFRRESHPRSTAVDTEVGAEADITAVDARAEPELVEPQIVEPQIVEPQSGRSEKHARTT